MRKLGFIVLLSFVLIGCFEDEPKIPVYYSDQYIDVAVDSVICFSGYEDFEYFVLFSSQAYDSLQWFNLSGVTPLQLPTSDSLSVSAIQLNSYYYRCLGFLGSDTTEYELELTYCGRNIYIPRAFTPVGHDGLNDTWYPSVYTTGYANTYSIYWEIRTLDGIKIYESADVNTFSHGWDGLFNGYLMSRGSYLFYIELTFQGEDPVEYTGWLEMME